MEPTFWLSALEKKAAGMIQGPVVSSRIEARVNLCILSSMSICIILISFRK